MFIDKNQLVMPWMIPAYYGYDADLKLIVEPGHQIPLNDVRPFKGGGYNLQQLTNHAQTFLRKTFEQFANSDGLLVSRQSNWKESIDCSLRGAAMDRMMLSFVFSLRCCCITVIL